MPRQKYAVSKTTLLELWPAKKRNTMLNASIATLKVMFNKLRTETCTYKTLKTIPNELHTSEGSYT